MMLIITRSPVVGFGPNSVEMNLSILPDLSEQLRANENDQKTLKKQT